jgi:hypothetical protein
VLFATMLTAAATTAVLAIFTNFRKPPRSNTVAQLKINPLSIEGSF